MLSNPYICIIFALHLQNRFFPAAMTFDLYAIMLNEYYLSSMFVGNRRVRVNSKSDSFYEWHTLNVINSRIENQK